MALVVKDRVQVSTSTTGTGTLTLGAALGGFQDFSVIGNGNTTYYTITNNGSWEVGIGTYTSSGTTLSRDTVLASSNSGSKINLSGSSVVFCTYPADKSVDIETAQTLTNKTINGSNNTITNVSLTTSVTGVLPEANGGTGTSAGNQMFKNRIINGAMGINQRNTTLSTNNSQGYFVDRMWGFSGASTAATYSQQSSSGLAGFPFFARAQRTAGNTGTAGVYIGQIIESNNLQDLQAQSITVSFWARAGANYSAASNVLTVFVRTGTVADQGLNVTISPGWTGQVDQTSNVTLTTSWQYFSRTFTVASNVQEMTVFFWNQTTGTAGAADLFDITGLQLEKGSTATSFDYRPFSTELSLCQRYYWQTNSETSYAGIGSGVMHTATQARIFIPYPVSMRAIPTMSATSLSSMFVSQGTDLVPNSFTPYANSKTCMVDLATGTGTIGRGAVLLFANLSTGSVQATAEL
jgi:hypothetical protein